jgi:hypothetical protein
MLVRCVAALAFGTSGGCQLILDEITYVDAGADAGTDASDARADTNSGAPSDAAAAAEAAVVDASEQPDAADADAGMALADASAPPDADPRGCDGAGSRVFFEDADEDGYGNPSSFEVACSAPAGYVSEGGDCHDDNGQVHPDQTEFFGQGYLLPGSNLVSFDYDCDGEEVEGPGQNRANPQGCEGFLPCSGAGYVEAERRDVPRANHHCGSRTILSCGIGLAICTGNVSEADSPYVCH